MANCLITDSKLKNLNLFNNKIAYDGAKAFAVLF